MVQVLPYVPSFGERLTPILNEALGKVGEGFSKLQKRKSDQAILEAIRSGKSSDTDLMTLWNRMSPEGRKENEAFLNSQLRIQESTHKEELKRETEDIQKAEKSEGILASAKKMRDLIKYTGSTKIPFTSSFNAIRGGLNREGLQKRNKFDVLAASAASFFRDLETKGQLPLGLYEEVIKPRLPNSELEERENLGRIEGLEELAKEYGGKTLKNAPKLSEKKEAQKSSSLTDEIAAEIFAEAGNDPEKARAIAKKRGYEF